MVLLDLAETSGSTWFKASPGVMAPEAGTSGAAAEPTASDDGAAFAAAMESVDGCSLRTNCFSLAVFIESTEVLCAVSAAERSSGPSAERPGADAVCFCLDWGSGLDCAGWSILTEAGGWVGAV